MTEKERIEALIRYEGLSLSQFANEINIQGSTLSHIMNGRNNPSLDVMKRILERFSEISPDWLIFGKEPMCRQISNSHEMPTLFDETEIPIKKPATFLEDTSNAKPESDLISISPIHPPKTIKRIVIFYSDNTFEEINK